jgi:predicted phosphodiesterase
MRIAVLSDIHGNVDALEAVLEHIEDQNVDTTVNLGDVVSGPLFPAECADRLIPLAFPTIRGNHERQLLTIDRKDMGQSDRYAASCLRPEHFVWISQFPETLQLSTGLLLVHGTPDSDLKYFLETVEEEGLRPASREEVRSRAATTAAPLVLCGHSHKPRVMRLDDGRLIVNPGSVGLPAYEVSRPFPHRMESGSPHARYAIVEKRDGEEWSAELFAVLYDWEKAAVVAENRKRPDWAYALRTGLACG